MKKLLFLFLLVSANLCAQQPTVTLFGSGVPTGGVASVAGTHYVDNSVSPAVVYVCTSVSVAAGPIPPAGTQTCNWTQEGGGGSTPGGTAGQTQVNNPASPGTLGGAGCQTFTDKDAGPINNDCDTAFKGLNPWPDIRRFGGVALNPNLVPNVSGITANVTGGVAAATLSSASLFTNGSGVSIWGVGVACTIATPGAPTVTAQVASGPDLTGMGVAAPTGATSFTYRVVAVDKNGCYSAASTATTLTTGNTVGFQSVSITNASKANNVNTYLTASAHGLVVGALAIISATTDDTNFGGECIVATVPDNTHFTCFSVQDTRASQVNTAATGGTVGWTNFNHVSVTPVTGALFYILYSASAVVQTSKLQNSSSVPITDATADDYGSTLQGTPSLLPGYFPSSPPGSGNSNGIFTTTIVSGAGTTSLVLAAAPTASGTGVTIVHDDGPALAAATASGSGGAYIPYSVFPNQFVINSYTALTNSAGTAGVLQQGNIFAWWPIEFPGNFQWFGNVFPAITGNVSFSNGDGVRITCGTTLPCLFAPSANGKLKLRGFNLQVQNNGQGLVIDNNSGLMAENLNFGDFGGVNGGTMPVLVRNAQFEEEWHNITAIGTQSGNSTTPLLFFNRCATLRINTINLAGRGIFANCIDFKIDYGRKQGGTAPAIYRAALGQAGSTAVGGVTIVPFTASDEVTEYELDTDPNPLIVTLTGGLANLRVNLGSPQPAASSVQLYPVISGLGYPTGIFFDSTAATPQNNNSLTAGTRGGIGATGTCQPVYGCANAAQESQLQVNQDLLVSGGNGLHISPFSVPIPTASVSTSCSASFPAAGTYTYSLKVVGADGVEGVPGLPSNAVTLNGTTQCASLTWSNVAGAIGYRVDVGFNGGNPRELFGGGCNSSFGTFVQNNACTDNFGAGNTEGTSLAASGSFSSWPGITAIQGLVLAPMTAGFFGKTSILNSPTANRTLTIPDVSGVNVQTSNNELAALTGQVPVAVNAAAPAFTSPGVQDGNGGAAVTTTPYTVLCDSATALRDRLTVIRLQTGASVVTAPDHTATGCGTNFAFSLLDDGAGAITVNRSGTDTFTIVDGSTDTQGATSFSLATGQYATLTNGAAGIWEVRVGKAFVTSVGLTVPSWLTVGGSPVTSSGTLAVTAATGQTSHQVIGTCGAATSFAPCALVAGDLPAVPLSGLATQAADTVVANASGSVAAPTAVAFPTSGTNGCAGATNALIYNTTTHALGCNTISGGGTVNLCTNNPAPGAYTPTSGATDCLGAGTYTLPTSVTTLAGNNTKIIGISAGAILQRGSGASGLKFTGNQSGVTGVALDDNAATSTARFIEITGNDDFVIGNIFQNHSATSSALPDVDVTGSATRAVITDNVWTGTQVDPCVSINSASTASGTIQGTVIRDNRVSAFGPSAATGCITSNQVSGSTVTDTTISGNKIVQTTSGATSIQVNGQAAVQNAGYKGWVVNNNQVSQTTVGGASAIKLFGLYNGQAVGNVIDLNGHAVSQSAMNMGDFYDMKVDVVVHGGGNENDVNCVDCENNHFNFIVDNAGGGLNCFTGSSSQNPFNHNIISGVCKMSANAIGVTIKGNASGKPANYNQITNLIVNCAGSASSTGVLFDIGNASTGTNNSITNATFNGCSGVSTVDINVNNSAMSNTRIGPGIFYDSGDTKAYNNSGTTTIFADANIQTTLASTYTNATTTFSSVTGLAFPIAASQTLTAKCTIVWQGSASTTGPKYQWTGPASPTSVAAAAFSAVTATTTTQSTATAFSTAMANAGTITTATNFVDTVTIGVINGTTSGTVQLQAAANGAGTLTIQPGSYCTIQ